MAFTTAPLSVKEPIAKPGTFWPTDSFLQWVGSLSADVDASAARLKTVSVTAQGASLGVTSFPTASLSAGLYRVEWYTRITRAATTNSSLTVTIGWTESTVTLTASGAAVTGNTTGTTQSGAMYLRVDQATPVSYSTTYASTGGTSMQYRLDLTLSQVDA